MSILMFLYPASNVTGAAKAMKGAWAKPITITNISDKILSVTNTWGSAFESKMIIELMDTQTMRIEACEFRLTKDIKNMTWVDQITEIGDPARTPGEFVEGHTLLRALHRVLQHGTPAASIVSRQSLYDQGLSAFETAACKSTYDMRSGVRAVVDMVLEATGKDL